MMRQKIVVIVNINLAECRSGVWINPIPKNIWAQLSKPSDIEELINDVLKEERSFMKTITAMPARIVPIKQFHVAKSNGFISFSIGVNCIPLVTRIVI